MSSSSLSRRRREPDLVKFQKSSGSILCIEADVVERIHGLRKRNCLSQPPKLQDLQGSQATILKAAPGKFRFLVAGERADSPVLGDITGRDTWDEN